MKLKFQILIFLLFSVDVFAQTTVPVRSVKAYWSQKILSTEGINTHMNHALYSDNYSTWVKSTLLELRIQHMRVSVAADEAQIPLLQDMHSSLGMTYNLQADPHQGTSALVLDYIDKLGLGAIDTVEGVNEPDGYFATITSNWETATLNFQKSLFQTIHDTSETRSLRVLGPAFISPNSFAEMHSLGLQNYMDATNIHNYHHGRNPENSGRGSVNQYGQHYGSLDYIINTFEKVLKDTNIIYATEVGYITSPRTPQSVHEDLPEDVEGIYMPRVVLFDFIKGVYKSYIYDLADDFVGDVSNNGYGLLTNTGHPKASYIALRNMNNILYDPGATFTTGSLEYGLNGNLSNVSTILTQKRNGEFYLIYWIHNSSFNVDQQAIDVMNGEFTKQDDYRIDIPEQAFIVQLKGKVKSAAYNCPNDGVTWTPVTQSGYNLSVNASAKVCFLKIVP